jgi:large subunit ribosomal protein L23
MPRFRDSKKDKKKEKPRKKVVKNIPKEAANIKIIEDPYTILKFVLMTEKCVRMIEGENKLVFIVERKSDKGEIKAAFEQAFNAKVENVTTVIDQKSRKKAFIKLKEAGAAGDIAVRLGII